MNKRSETVLFGRIVAAIALLAFGLVARADEPKSHERYALLVGVNEYEHNKLKPLHFAENDASALSVVLKSAQYHVTLLTTKSASSELKPTKLNIEKQLGQILKECHKGDTIVIAFSGHGLQFEGEADAFFCPADAKPFKTNTDSLVSIGKIYRDLDASFATMKVLLVDACRDDPAASRGVSRGITSASAPPPPQGVAALFSCGVGEESYETPKLKHGIFFYHVIEGLKGFAADNDQEVTFASLASYVSRRVRRDAAEIIGDGAAQSPNLKADYTVEPVLLSKSRSRTDDDLLREEWSDFVKRRKKAFGWSGNGSLKERGPQRHAAWRLEADAGDPRAQALLACLLTYSKEKSDRISAVALFRKAADQGEVIGMMELARCISYGSDVDKDEVEGVKWLRRAADRGEAEAQRYMGLRFEQGRGVAKDGKEAVAWYLKAAAQNDMYSMWCLGRMYDSGADIPKDDVEAAKWYRKSGELGHSSAQSAFATMLENGRGVAKNLPEAIEWYRKAAAHFDPNAKKALERLGVKP